MEKKKHTHFDQDAAIVNSICLFKKKIIELMPRQVLPSVAEGQCLVDQISV